MDPINNKFIKIVSLVGIIIITLAFISNKVFLNNKTSNLPSGNTTPQISNVETKKVDAMINEAIKTQLDRTPTGKEDDFVFNMGTTQEHWKNLGIENAKISGVEEKDLYLITIEIIKTQLEYYSTKKEESLNKVKNLYLPEEFEQYKKDAGISFYIDSNIQNYEKIKTIKFSKPRTYKDLPDRIGIITYINFVDEYTNNLTQLFIFKNINGEWKIEKQDEITIRVDIEENTLIQEIKDENKIK